MKTLLLITFVLLALVGCEESPASIKVKEDVLPGQKTKVCNVIGDINSVYELKYEGKTYLVFGRGGIVEHKSN